MEILQIKQTEKKVEICQKILKSLPQWFGIENSTVGYIEGSKSKPMFAISINNEIVGFVSLKVHFKKSCELYVLGILPKFHRKGLGKKLISKVEEEMRGEGIKYMTVKTLSEGRSDPYYDKTRNFYLGIGYEPLEEFKSLWDKSNPCLFLIKSL